MAKKCIVCDDEAKYKIKDSSDYYCQECAEENFNALDLLLKLDEEAQRLKDFLEKRVAPQEEEENEQEH